MRAAGVLLVILGACTSAGVGDDSYPVTPPGPGGQGNSGTGGGGGGGSGSNGPLLTARICILSTNDSTKLDSCATDVEAGIKVQMQDSGGGRTLAGSTIAISNGVGNGVVTATRPSAGVAYWVITPPDPPTNLQTQIFRSFVQYDPKTAPTSGGQLIPVFLDDDYQALTNGHGALYDPDEGAIFAVAVDAGGVVTGAKATLNPATPRASWYADTNANAWTQDSAAGTTTKGLVWYPGLPSGAMVKLSFAKGALLGDKSLTKLLANYTTFLYVTMM